MTNDIWSTKRAILLIIIFFLFIISLFAVFLIPIQQKSSFTLPLFFGWHSTKIEVLNATTFSWLDTVYPSEIESHSCFASGDALYFQYTHSFSNYSFQTIFNVPYYTTTVNIFSSSIKRNPIPISYHIVDVPIPHVWVKINFVNLDNATMYLYEGNSTNAIEVHHINHIAQISHTVLQYYPQELLNLEFRIKQESIIVTAYASPTLSFIYNENLSKIQVLYYEIIGD